MTVRIASVVEGHGEREAVPVLLRRLAFEAEVFDIDVRPPHRLPRSAMTGETVAKAVRMQRARVGAAGVVIVLFDSDTDDPADIAQHTRSVLAAHSAEAVVAVAVREYEAWFLAGIDSLAGTPSIAPDARFEGDPEAPAGAKGRLADLMTESYKETLHQARFTARMDLDLVAERSPSFRTFRRAFREALGA